MRHGLKMVVQSHLEAMLMPDLRLTIKIIVLLYSSVFRIPQKVLDTLTKILLTPGKTLNTNKALSSMLLKEVLPGFMQDLPFDVAHQDESRVPYIVSVSSFQV